MAEKQTVTIALKPRERLTLVDWLSTFKWKNYEDRRKRRRLRRALCIQPNADYRVVNKETGRDPRTLKPVYQGYIEIGRWVGAEDADDRKFQRIVEKEGRHAHLFDLTMDQIDFLIAKLKDHSTDDGQSDRFLDVEETLHEAKKDEYKAPDRALRWDELDDEMFEDVKDPETNDDEPKE